MRGVFERQESEHFTSLVNRETVAIDVGANVGIFTIPMAGKAAEVWSFEPSFSTVERLNQNIALNSLKNVRVFSAACGDHEGTVELLLSDDSAFCSTTESYLNKRNGQSIVVPLRMLDSVWNEQGRPPISAVKIDVEGAELAVLQGAEELLSTCLPAIHLESNSVETTRGLRTWLECRGYSLDQPSGYARWNYLANAYRKAAA
jgi:FkbM family methyltransferase